MRRSCRRNGIVIAASGGVVLHRAHATCAFFVLDPADVACTALAFVVRNLLSHDDDDEEDGGVVDDYDDFGDDDDDGVDDVVDDDGRDDDDGVDDDDNDDDDDDDDDAENRFTLTRAQRTRWRGSLTGHKSWTTRNSPTMAKRARWRDYSTRAECRPRRPLATAKRNEGMSKRRQLDPSSGEKDGKELATRGTPADTWRNSGVAKAMEEVAEGTSCVNALVTAGDANALHQTPGSGAPNFQQPCGPVIFVEANKRRRVQGAVLRWENAKGSRRRFYMKNVYGSKGNVVAAAKGAVLDMCLFEGFGAGAANTPFYNDLQRQGGFVLGREFFDLLDEKDIALDVPCEVGPDLELSTPLQLCGGCEPSGAAGEGGDLGSGEATHVQREDARGQFDDSEDEATPRPSFSASRERDRSVLFIPGVRQKVAVDPGEEAVQCGSDLEPGEEHGANDNAVGGEGAQRTPQKRRGDCQENVVGSSKKQKTRTPTTMGEKRKGRGVEEDHPGSKRPASKQKQPASGPFTTRPAIDVDAGYFLEYKDDVRTRREFEISPAQIVDLAEWEDLYNQRSQDPVLVGTIKEAMQYAFENKEQTYELPIFKLTPLGLQKPTPGTKAQRLKPEDWKDELAGEYYYYAVCGQHNAAAAPSLLGSEVAKKYNFERWPAQMLYFSDDDFEGYFLVSSQDNKTDLKAPPRQLKLSMKDIRWQWKHDGCPRAVMGNPSGKQDQVRAWRKKEKVEGDWFVQVLDPDAHCWKAMESFTDNEKCRVLKKVLACEVVWVQAGSPSLAKLGKLSVQDMVQLVKCDRVLVRLWNYYQFKHEKRSDADWIQRYPFLKSRSAVFRKFESQGLDDKLWDNSRKHVSDSALFKDCPPYMGCDQDNSIEVTEKLAGHKKLSVDWRNKVLSVLNESRLKSREVALAEGIVHIKWKDTGDVTSIVPFANDPLEADMRSAELKEVVAATKSHTFILDLCEPVDLKLWKAQVWETLDSYLQTWCPSHWTLVVFVPRQHNLTFLASMHHLSFVKLLEGKWVRRVQQKKSFPVGNNLYTEEDRMYILFKGDNLRANTSVVYEGNLPRGAAAAVRLPQRVTQTDGSVYGDMEHNPTQFVSLLDFLGKKGEGVVFLGKPHSRSIWDLLKAGRHVVTMEGNAELSQFTMQVVKSEVNSDGHNCEFMVVKPTRDKVWSNKTDMWFKLSERKRNKIYDFLFLQTRPRKNSDAEYVRRKDHMFALLDNYHFASRMNAKTFLDRLQSLYFVESEEQLKLASYASLISCVSYERRTGEIQRR
ncbi:hypothetical protein CBR_g8694 [Chara braunii]|uniref:Uncharacterized protein n=1 Tax=Chara braunii TaxID=69332 RepID=A0A388KMV6_CHABU|nr:hypothetical protein CBR_g8694 [Chara braunii]|eukprot:GBG71273.1 hypothetical protein CBR_g8694 [Chara braunii]